MHFYAMAMSALVQRSKEAQNNNGPIMMWNALILQNINTSDKDPALVDIAEDASTTSNSENNSDSGNPVLICRCWFRAGPAPCCWKKESRYYLREGTVLDFDHHKDIGSLLGCKKCAFDGRSNFYAIYK